MPAGTILPSRGVLDRQRIGESIVATARTHAAEVAARLEETLAPFVAEGETPTDFLALQRQLARYVDHLLATLIEADEAHLRELGDDRDPRRRRNDAAEVLYDKLIQMRTTLTGLFGEEQGNELLGIEGRTPRDPLALHRHATRALEQLRAPDPELPARQLNGIQLDRDALAAELQPATDELAAAIQDVTRELREAETTQGVKDKAVEEFDQVVGGIARMLIGADTIAGFPNYSQRIRLTLPATGGSRSEEEEPPAEELPPGEGLPPSEGTSPSRESAVVPQPAGDQPEPLSRRS